MKESKVITEYSLEELCENSRLLFHVYPEIVLGAVFSNKKERFTIDEVKTAIDAFLKKEVI